LEREYKAVVIGASAGGMKAIRDILLMLPANFKLPMIIVEHISPQSDNFWIHSLDKNCKLHVKEAEEKERIESGKVYIAPPGYHLLIEKDYTFSLSADERVNYSRPSIDVLFETAADAYTDALIGIILTGANYDGAHGLKTVKKRGGLAIVQSLVEAEVQIMPQAAKNAAKPDFVLTKAEIAQKIIDLQS
jgi:two-component system, chemotaxis family, protein-glutamate methylesterase/glutaminase